MSEDKVTELKPKAKDRKSRKVSVEELVKAIRVKNATQQNLIECQKMADEADIKLKVLIKRASASTFKKAHLQILDEESES